MPKAVKFKEVLISTDGRTVWVNTELGCAARYSSLLAESFKLRVNGLSSIHSRTGGWDWWVEAVYQMHGIKVSKQYKPSLSAAVRLSKDAHGNEKPWSPFELHNLYMRGWRDGAGTVAERPNHSDVPEYSQGYKDGYAARSAAANKAAKRLRYKPNSRFAILRLTKEQ